MRPPADSLAKPRGAVAVAAVLSAMALVVLDASLANMALPTIAQELHVGSGAAVLVVSAYQAGLVMALLPWGALGERFGYRRMFSLGVALFTAASVACALAPTLAWLVAARFVQGLGGAAVMALGIALMRFSTPAERFTAVISWNALTVALCAAVGPSLGALILSLSGWPVLFAANLPLGVAVLLAARALPATPPAPRDLDLVSMGLNALVFCMLIVGVEAAAHDPMRALGLAVCGGLALLALLNREAPKRFPLVPVDLLGNGAFRASVLASICCFAGQTLGLVALPFYLQQPLGLSPIEAALYLTAWPLGIMSAAAVAGRWANRGAGPWFCVFGSVLMAAGLGALAITRFAAAGYPLMALAAMAGIGFGLFQTPNNRNMFLSAPPERGGAAGGLQGVARITGQIIGAALAGSLFSALSPELAPRVAFGMGAGLALAAGLVSLARVQGRSALTMSYGRVIGPGQPASSESRLVSGR